MNKGLAVALLAALMNPTAVLAQAEEEPEAEASAKQATARAWTAGFGGRIPDGLPLEVTRRLDERWSLRGWITPPIGMEIEEHQEAESESFFDSIVIATPATNVTAAVSYGPAFGVEGLYRPFLSGFFVAGGLSYYQLVGRAEKSTPLLICFDTTTPCNASTASYKTSGELSINAVAREQGVRTAASTGWLFEVGERTVIGLTMGGLSYKVWNKRSVSVDSEMEDDPGLSDLAKEQMQYVLPAKEDKLEGKVVDKMDQYNRPLLPVFGLSAGVRF